MSAKKKKPAPRKAPKTYAFQVVILPFASHHAWSLLLTPDQLTAGERKPPEWFLNLYETGEQRFGPPKSRPRPLAGGVFVARTDQWSPQAFARATPLVGTLAEDWKLARSTLRDCARQLAALRPKALFATEAA